MSEKGFIKVVGVTTDRDAISKMLGTTNDAIGLYQETTMGRYYARILPNGDFAKEESGEIKLIRLMSAEQASAFEAAVCAAIESFARETKTLSFASSRAILNKRTIDEEMEKIRRDTATSAKVICEKLPHLDVAAATSAATINPKLVNERMEEIQRQVAINAKKMGAEVRATCARINSYPKKS